MASFAARFSFVFLALDANPAPVSPSSGTQDAATETMGTVVADSGSGIARTMLHLPRSALPRPTGQLTATCPTAVHCPPPPAGGGHAG